MVQCQEVLSSSSSFFTLKPMGDFQKSFWVVLNPFLTPPKNKQKQTKRLFLA